MTSWNKCAAENIAASVSGYRVLCVCAPRVCPSYGPIEARRRSALHATWYSRTRLLRRSNHIGRGLLPGWERLGRQGDGVTSTRFRRKRWGRGHSHNVDAFAGPGDRLARFALPGAGNVEEHCDSAHVSVCVRAGRASRWSFCNLARRALATTKLYTIICLPFI